jgi:hypothetical protein
MSSSIRPKCRPASAKNRRMFSSIHQKPVRWCGFSGLRVV